MSVLFLAEAGTGGGLAGFVADWSLKIMDVLGSPGAGLANALDSIIPVLPSEVVLPLAGFAANKGTINLYAALLWTTVGSIVGSVVMYYIGAAFGRERVLGWAKKIPLVQVHEVERTETWFLKHGTKTVFFGRMVPVFRSLISIPAGVNRMPLGKFILYTALGSAIWNTIFVLAGYALGANWAKVEEYGGIFSKLIIALIVLAVGYFIVSRLIRRRRDRAAGGDGNGDGGGDGPAGGVDPAGDRQNTAADNYSGTVYGQPRYTSYPAGSAAPATTVGASRSAGTGAPAAPGGSRHSSGHGGQSRPARPAGSARAPSAGAPRYPAGNATDATGPIPRIRPEPPGHRDR